ncbi:hypothetical protein QKT49_gp347 [Acanthamoeba castellanii medusavirus]|uniref:Uncharacterized protein n=1 Tax=Acanthamoeba castellanii medusavirus J1 TaxID=3114988 RepID=A0A3T1CX72_9VIRU|nr:hypothetical protein QKT49_gp347 [Acanthamoeba castellanii medusavirus]BBI30416.1 hypothetical protein [Acanthamoeba castellanii medusavirus J1]
MKKNHRHIEVGVKEMRQTNWRDGGIVFSATREVTPVNTSVSIRDTVSDCLFESRADLYADGCVHTKCSFSDKRNGVRVEWGWNDAWAPHMRAYYRLWLAAHTEPIEDIHLKVKETTYSVNGHHFRFPRFKSHAEINDATQGMRAILDAYKCHPTNE